MSRFKFEPNAFAIKKFNLSGLCYEGEGLPPLLREKVLGKENYSQYMIAQDPLCGGKKTGTISIINNRGETNPEKMDFRDIGTITQLS